jgi:UDP-N-acetylmuramoylalanine--D-glutamate ligase
LPLSSETRLFTRICPTRIVGITGSSGKTTTTALVGKMLEAAGWRTWIGGNIGQPLISHLEHIRPTDIVVMELSSFQLDLFAPWSWIRADLGAAHRQGALFDPAGWSPPIAAVLNVTPNHLDRHPSMQAYVAAKEQILVHQRRDDVAVLNLDNSVTRSMGERTKDQGRRVLWFSLEQELPQGVFARGAESVLRLGRHEEVLYHTEDLKLLGRHNQANVLAACALVVAVYMGSQQTVGVADLPVEALRLVATTFRGVEHRLELVREHDCVRWYNDSIATSPERTVAALQSFDSPIVLLGGGRDKHLAWDDMAALTWRKVRHLILFGEAAGLIETAMRNSKEAALDSPYPTHIHQVGTLAKAVELAAGLAQPGDVVLLSPGGTSFDAYRDFTARGEHFRDLVRGLE